VQADGRAGDVRVVETPGYPRLVDAAVRAVRQAAFRPAMRGGRPVASILRLRIRFVLE
jgi:TonB family protein